MKQSILILGSEGFIGSHLVAYFKENDFDVYEADIVLKESLNYFLVNPEIPDFSFIFSKVKYDVCVNATGAANVQLSFNHPSLDFTLNTFNVYNILNAIRLHSPDCKFINLGSAAVYGNPALLPIREDSDVKPLSPYGYHKWYSEQVCYQFFALYGVRALSLRIFSAYGVGLRKQLFWDVYKKATDAKRKDGIVTLYGTGNESRDFIYVTDICRAIHVLTERAEFKGEAVNVAGGTETTIHDAVKLFLNLIDESLTVKFGGEVKRGDPLNWRADISKLKGMGFSPAIDIREGLSSTVKWLKEKQ